MAMSTVKNSDINALMNKIEMQDFNYQTIREHEDQLSRLKHWPLYREILEQVAKTDSSNQAKHLDHLKITR